MPVTVAPATLTAPATTNVTMAVQADDTKLKTPEYPPGTLLPVAADGTFSFKVVKGTHLLVITFDIASLPPNPELVSIVEIDPADPANSTVVDSFFGIQPGRICQIVGT